MGLDGFVTGVVIALGLLWDGISDPLIGVLSDRLRSRYGRRHPFMAISILPMGLGFIGLFAPPDSVTVSQWQLACWLLFWSLWVRTFVTAFAIPHLAMSAEISTDYTERSQVLGARMGSLFLFSVLLPAAGLGLIFTEQGGQDGRFIAENYLAYGILSCLVCWLTGTACVLGTRHFSRPHTIQPPGEGLRDVWRALLQPLSNRTFRLVIGYDLAASVSYGTIAGLNMLAWVYFWELSAREISMVLALPSVIAIALVMLSLGPLSQRFEKGTLLKYAVIVILLDMLWLYPPRLLGLLPDNGTPAIFWLNFLFMLLFIYGFLLRTICSMSIVADITDEHELTHGVRREASFFAVLNFLHKLASIAGPLYSGIVLSVIGLETGALPGEVPQGVLNQLALALGIGAIPPMLLALVFILRIKMDRHSVAAIQTQLARKT